MAYTGLYNGNGQRQITVVSGLVYTGLYSPDGQYNGVVSNGSVYVGRYHACGAYNVTVATTLQSSAIAPDGSYYIYNGTSGYVLPGGSLGTVSTLPAWVINQSNPPNIALDWMNNLGYNSTSATPTAASLATVVNSTGGYVNNAAGTWASIAPNTPRRSDLGLLVEEQRANGVRNNSMQGASPGTPGTIPTNWAITNNGGLSTSVIGTGTESGIDYIDLRFFGTSAGTQISVRAEASGAVAASSGQTWTASVFEKLVGGTLTNVTGAGVTVQGFDVGLAVTESFPSSISATLPSTALGLDRFNVTATLAVGTTTSVITRIDLYINNTSAVDITVRFGWPQLELGSSVTSPIRTTAAAVTRASDVVTLTTPPMLGNAYSTYAKATPPAPVAGLFNNLFQLDDGSANNRFIIRRLPDSSLGMANVSGAVTQFNLSAYSWTTNVSGKVAGAVSTTDVAFTFNGAAPTTFGANALPLNPSVARIGSGVGSGFFNGFLEYSALWANQRVPNAQLVSMTT